VAYTKGLRFSPGPRVPAAERTFWNSWDCVVPSPGGAETAEPAAAT